MTDTASIDGASRSIATASSGVMFGRFSSSSNFAPAARLTPENFAMKIVSDPMVLIESRSDSSKPRMSDVMPTIDVMPMTTPSTVRTDRILLTRSVSQDIRTISSNSDQRMVCPLLPPQGFNRIQARGPRRRIEPEEQADARRHGDAQYHRPHFDDRRQRAHTADDVGHQESEPRAHHAAERGQRDRFGEDLP